MAPASAPEADQDLRLYAVLRSDIRMSSGKAIAQAGHAYLQSMLCALDANNPHAKAYARLTPGTKIALDGGTDVDILKLQDQLSERGIPHALIIDHGHVELPDFDGSPTLTALGVGPLSRKDARRLLSSLPLWKATRKGGAP